MSTLKVTNLWIYPIKSLAGIQLKSTHIEPRGLQYDRRWVLVDQHSVFVNQRDYPEMVFLQPVIEENQISIHHKNNPEKVLTFSLAEPDTVPAEVQVWDDKCMAKPVGAEADQWFSEVLGKEVRLMFMHKDGIRPADPRYAVNENDEVSFADGYPILIISEESLALLNSKTDEHVPMNRFRANIIISGGIAHQEDQLRKININGIEMYGVKPCARCVMTTIDTHTGQKGKEPLKTLVKYRKLDRKILFGENFIPISSGHVSVGDQIDVLETKEAIKF